MMKLNIKTITDISPGIIKDSKIFQGRGIIHMQQLPYLFIFFTGFVHYLQYFIKPKKEKVKTIPLPAVLSFPYLAHDEHHTLREVAACLCLHTAVVWSLLS